MKINVQTFPSVNEPDVIENRFYSVDWEKFADRLTKHKLIPHKEAIDLFTMATFKENSRRRKENVVTSSAITLDIDKHITISEFKDRFGHLEYVLYTTFSHSVANHRFRVVIPFVKQITAEEYENGIPMFAKMFEFCDTASFSISQSFYLPSYPENKMGIVEGYHNKGKFFDYENVRTALLVEEIEADIERLSSENVAELTVEEKNPELIDRFSVFPTDTIFDAERELKKTSLELDYDDWIQVGMCLKTRYGDEGYNLWYAFSEASPKFNDDNSYMEKKWKSFSFNGAITSFGFLVNIRKANPRK